MTIKDIARLSGCGVATVSRVLNQHPDVSEETRRKVMAVVEEQGFQPNNNAKHLKQQAGTSISILVKGTQNMLFADLVERIQALLRDRGRDAAVYYLDEDANEVAYALQSHVIPIKKEAQREVGVGGPQVQVDQAVHGSFHLGGIILTNLRGHG